MRAINVASFPIVVANGAIGLSVLSGWLVSVATWKWISSSFGGRPYRGFLRECVDVRDSLPRLGRYLRYSPTFLLAEAITKLKQHDALRATTGGHGSSILFLHPFTMDAWQPRFPFDMEEALSLEQFICTQLEGLGPLIALGPPGSRSRKLASRVVAAEEEVAEEDWKAKVEKLLVASQDVLVVPDDTPDTLWQIDRIFSSPDHLAKTVFLNLRSASSEHPHRARSRSVDGESNGEVFLRVLQRLVGRNDLELPPLDQILCASHIANEVHLVCSREAFNPGVWGSSPRLALYLRDLHRNGVPVGSSTSR